MIVELLPQSYDLIGVANIHAGTYKLIDDAKKVKNYAHAVDVPNVRKIGRYSLPKEYLAAMIQRMVEITAIPHIVTRDVNKNELIAKILYCKHEQIQNILICKGDEFPINSGVRNVNDTRVTDLIEMAYNISTDTFSDSCIIGTVNPLLDNHMTVMKNKKEAGASVFVLQIGDPEKVIEFARKCKESRIDGKMIASVMSFKDEKDAKLARSRYRLGTSDRDLERMKKDSNEGLKIAMEHATAYRKSEYIDGLYVVSRGNVDDAKKILKAIK